MNKDEPPEGNEALTQALNLIEKMYSGGTDTPAHFHEFVQHLLSKTIMQKDSFVCLSTSNSDVSAIHGPRRKPGETSGLVKGRDLYHPVRLNDGNYLYLFYENFIDRDDNNFLKTNISKMSYQLDAEGHQQLFRFDYNRLVKTPYPASHVHVYGEWSATAAGVMPKLKPLHKVHFPVVRPTIEGMIKILVNDFEIQTNTDRSIWEPMLDATERKFKEVMSKQIHRAEATEKNKT